jgi:tellurite resistance-related uncharacterized protein
MQTHHHSKTGIWYSWYCIWLENNLKHIHTWTAPLVAKIEYMISEYLHRAVCLNYWHTAQTPMHTPQDMPQEVSSQSKSRTDYGRHTVLHRALTTWNSRLKKKQIKKHLMEQRGLWSNTNIGTDTCISVGGYHLWNAPTGIFSKNFVKHKVANKQRIQSSKINIFRNKRGEWKTWLNSPLFTPVSYSATIQHCMCCLLATLLLMKFLEQIPVETFHKLYPPW